MNPTEPNVSAIRQRRPMTEARLKANRENAKKAALSGRSGRPRGSMDGNRLSLRERCRVRDEEHVATLERIAADDSHPGFQLVAIRDLMDRGWGRPSALTLVLSAPSYAGAYHRGHYHPDYGGHARHSHRDWSNRRRSW